MSILGRIAATGFATVAFLSITTVPTHAQTLVSFGDTISDPGLYVLDGHESGSGRGITIESDDVTLLLLRFTLSGDGSDVGIFADGYDFVSIIGGRVSRFNEGIQLRNCEYATVQGTRIDHCTDDGLDLEDADESLFQRIRIDHNSHGVEAHGSNDNRFLSVLTSENRFEGMRLANFFDFGGPSNDNKIRLCWSAYNGRNGIHVEDSDGNDVKQNQCVDNGGAGIVLASVVEDDFGPTPQAGSHDNEVSRNWCVFNLDGIVVEQGSTNNTIANNTALASDDDDLVEENDGFPCANTWLLNFHLTRGGAGASCIF